MKMLGDCELFVQLCENSNIPAPPEILEKIKIGSKTGELRLSSMSIVVPICEILARVLATSTTIRKVDLGDCMLLTKGLSVILNALSEGSNVTTLKLKGNNISGTTVGQLGKIFLHNNTLKCLSLEWNSIGNDIDEFTKFSEALGANNNIVELDLRYNQISPYCADSLAKALSINKSLMIVDLAWNTLGLRGGEMLLDAMRKNRSITRLNLRGNCIPDDIIYAIDESIRENQRASIISQAGINESCKRIANHFNDKESRKNLLETNDLTIFEGTKDRDFHEIRENDSIIENTVEKSKIIEIGGCILDIETNNEKSGKIIIEPSNSNKIIELNQILQERSSAIELLTREIDTRAKETETAKNLINELENEIKLLKAERECFNVEKTREIEELREIQEKTIDNWQRDYKRLEEKLRETLSRDKELETRVQRYEHEIRKITIEMTKLREKNLTQTRTYEDIIGKNRTDLHRAKREIKERENRHKIDTNVLRQSLKESTEGLEDCQTQLQKCRIELRDNMENLSILRTRVTELERHNSRLLRIEESYVRLKDDKKSLDEKLLDDERKIATLQRKIANLQGELIEPQRRYDLVKDELEQEREKTARLRIELTEERTRQQEQNLQIQTLNSQITGLNNQINEIQNSHVEAIRERDKERKLLKDVISNKERDFNDLKTEEVQRASQLYAAFSKYYLGSIGPNTTL